MRRWSPVHTEEVETTLPSTTSVAAAVRAGASSRTAVLARAAPATRRVRSRAFSRKRP
jgi:hypothetical protein